MTVLRSAPAPVTILNRSATSAQLTSELSSPRTVMVFAMRANRSARIIVIQNKTQATDVVTTKPMLETRWWLRLQSPDHRNAIIAAASKMPSAPIAATSSR